MDTEHPNLSEMTDEEIIERVRDDNKDAYAEIISRYEDKLRRYASYLIKNEEIAKDAVQSAFIKAYKNIQSFNTQLKFSSWMYRIVHNESLNMIKKESRSVSLQERVIDWFSNINDSSIEDEYSKEEVATYLQNALKSLPVEYYEPLALYYLEEKSYEEISDILQIPIGTVGTRINRGKKRLQTIV